MGAAELIGVATAAELLGVRRQTVYAYVSRGILTRIPGTDARGHQVSLFERGAVQALVEGRHRTRTGVFELHLDTAVTDLTSSGELRYRGLRAEHLAATASFEEVAELLWQSPEAGRWEPDETTTTVCRSLTLVTTGAAGMRPPDRVRLALALLAAADPDSPAATGPESAPDPERVRRAGRAAIVAAAMCLLQPAAETVVPPWPGSVAATVTRGLLPPVEPRHPAIETSAADALTPLVQRAMILLADHELATSTVAARAAASTHATPYLSLLTGAAAMGGPLHGGASGRAEQLLRLSLLEGADATLDRYRQPPPGFGHKVYLDADPRADDLLDQVLDTWPHLSDPVDALCLQVRRRDGLAPNIDFALAALAVGADLPPDSGETIFLIARLAGLTAHCLEELEYRLGFRPRAVYTGAAEAARHEPLRGEPDPGE